MTKILIKNKTRKTILSREGILLTSAAQHAKGLMFSKEKNDFGLIFEFKKPKHAAIHMMFVYYPIDILWLDEKNTVLETSEQVQPFTPYLSPQTKVKTFIELPQGTIKKSKTKKKDKITWQALPK